MKVKINNRDKTIINFLKGTEGKTVKEIVEATGYGNTSVKNRIKRLKKRNIVEKVGDKELNNDAGIRTAIIWGLVEDDRS